MSFINRIPLRWKLPAIIAATVIGAVAVFGSVAYRSVRQSLIGVAHARLSAVTQQVVHLSQPMMANRVRAVKLVAADPALVAVLENPGKPAPAAALAALAALAKLGPDSNATLAVELRDLKGATVLALRKRASVHAPPPLETDTSGVSPLLVHGDSAMVEYGANVLDGARVVGRVVQLRSTLATRSAARGLFNLIGPDAAILMGSLGGSEWTDLQHIVQRPPHSGSLEIYEREGRVRYSVSSAIPGAPLAVAIEFPEDVVLAPLFALVWGFAGVALLVVVGAAAAGVVLSRGVTASIERVTHAAEAITASDFTHVEISTNREDEVGRLARAFSAMATSVRGARDTLEEQVAQRTAELRSAQAELVRKERLATLGQLSSGVGHELRNPLGVMTNAVYFLEATLEDAPEKVKEYLGILRTQIRLSVKIVTDLLDFARVKPPQRQAVQVERIVDEQLARITVPSGVEVKRDLPLSLAPVHVDPVQVGQVVLNIVTNAVQATEEKGGTVTIRAKAWNGSVRLMVEDSGPGIPEQNLEKIFEPLFTTRARGIGLGLSVSRSLAGNNGGALTVASAPGLGATFTLELPAALHG